MGSSGHGSVVTSGLHPSNLQSSIQMQSYRKKSAQGPHRPTSKYFNNFIKGHISSNFYLKI